MAAPKKRAGFRQPSRADALIEAAEKGDVDEVSRLVERTGMDVNVRDFKRQATPLMRAAAASHHDVVAYLVSRGAAVGAVDNVGWNAIMWCCWGAGAGRGWVHGLKGTYSVLNLLINEGGPVTVEHQSMTGYTALMFFCKYLGQRGVVKAASARRELAALAEKGGPSAKRRARAGPTAEERNYALSPVEEQRNALVLLLACVQITSPDAQTSDAGRTRRLVMRRNRYGESAMDLARRRDIRRLLQAEINRVPDSALDVPSIVDDGGARPESAMDERRAAEPAAGRPGAARGCCGRSRKKKAPKTGNKFGDSPYFRQPEETAWYE